jgi:hypothetical protein
MGTVTVDAAFMEKVKAAYGSKTGDPNYNPEYDVNQDGIIDMRDIVYFARNYGKTVELPQGLAVGAGALGLLLILAVFFMAR